MNIDHISVSRAGVWNECEQKYKFRYHLKTPVTEPTQPYFVYGKLIHKIIEEYTISKGKKNLNNLVKECLVGDIILEEGSDIIPGKFLSKEYLDKIPKHLAAYLKVARKFGFDGDCEWKFNFDLDPPNHKCVFGFIDRLIQKDGRYVIIDYKTTKKGGWRKSKKTVASDLQLQCYAMIVMNTFNVDPSQIFTALYYLEGEDFVGATFTKETLESTRKTLLDIYNTIDQSDPDKVRGRTGNHCYRCDYRKMCRFFALT